MVEGSTGAITDGPPMGRGVTRGVLGAWREPAACVPGLGFVDRILAARGLRDPEQAQRFLHPSLAHLHDPSRMPDMDRAAERILSAARAGEPIVIYGDYDVDGVTAASILHRAIRRIHPRARVSTYVPHRLQEGYGLNSKAVAQLAAEGARLIITVDCGITSVEPALVAKAAGVDLIITDHHNPPEEPGGFPSAFAIVHPRAPGSAYPFTDLSGSAVAFKVAWRLCTMHSGTERVSPELRELLLDLLALAALGVVADVVPLRDENRAIARFGLSRLAQSPLVGLRALLEASGLVGPGRVDAQAAGFTLAPKLNAVGRLGHAREAVELFTTDDPDRAAAIAQELDRANRERQRIERAIADEAAALAEDRGMTGDDRRAIVLAHPEWHQGVVGIVCSRLVERFARPTILLRIDGGSCHGSGRSIDGFNLHGALRQCSTLLESFGGHDMAAGVRLSEANLDAFTENFTAVANREISPGRPGRTFAIDTDARLDELTAPALRELEKLAPFGRSNPQIIVRLDSLRLAEAPKPLGKDGRHIALVVRQGGAMARVVGWNWAARVLDLPNGARLQALVHPRLSTWNGTTRLEPELVDLRLL